ncbi:MAG TPA: hypothetical protein VK874_14915 [Gaiellaceae bacterium]|nr:hypothetical protein [Gaiellaceae bacterium]
MRTSVLAAALVSSLFVQGAGAAGPANDRSVTSPGAVSGLARSGSLVAFASGPSPGDCHHVRIWNLVTRGVHRLGAKRPCGPVTSTGQGIVGPVAGGNRVLWTSYVGGNIREWTLWTATTTRRAPRQLRFVARDVDAPSPFVLGDGSPTILPYAVDAQVIALAPSGARLFAWTAPVRVTDLSASRDRLAALLADGRLVLLDRTGAVVRTETPPGRVAGLQALIGGVAYQTGTTLLARTPAGDRRTTLPAGARFLDYVNGLALYARGTQLRGRRVATGSDAALRTGTFGALEHSGLSYAGGRRVASVAWSRVAALVP